MLLLTIPAMDLWDEENEKFISRKEQTLQLEHSLVSISKWESKWHKPFLGKEEKTKEETLDYIRCMTITQNVDPDTYRFLTDDHYRMIEEYMQDPHTATTFPDDKSSRGGSKIVTAEVVYAWMFSAQMPMECQKWHFNRLMTQIRACGVLNQPQKKMSKNEVMRQNAALNASRRQRLNSKG